MKRKNNLLFLLVLTIFMLYLPVFAQENQTPKEYILSQIDIKGTKHPVGDWISLKVGERIQLDEEMLSSLFKKLSSYHLFKDISIEKEQLDKDHILLKIHLEEFPSLHKVEAKGIKSSEFEEITKDLHIKTGQKISPSFIDKIKGKLHDHFINKGYPNPKINFFIGKAIEGKSILTIPIDKGKRTKVKKILFEGNKALSSSILRREMKNTRGNLFKRSKYVKEKFEEDLKRLVERYQQIGYRDAKILSSSVIEKQEAFFISIKIEEGKKYYLSDISFIGNSFFPTQDLYEIAGYKKGDPYNRIGLLKNITDAQNDASIKVAYLNRGYLNSSFEVVEKLVDENQIALEVYINEKKKTKFNKISFEGNTITKDKVILRELTTYPGDYFSKHDIQKTLFRLAGTGFFDAEKIIPEILPTEKEDFVNLNWKLKEKNSSQVQLQAGFGKETGVIGTLALNLSNFALGDVFKKKAWKPIPQGNGQTLRIAMNQAKDFQSYEFSFTEPWIGKGAPTSLTFGVDYSKAIYRKETASSSSSNSRNPLNIFSELKEIGNNKKSEKEKSLKNFGLTTNLRRRLSWPDDFFVFNLSLNYNFYKRKETNLGFEGLPLNGVNHDLNIGTSIGRSSLWPDYYFPNRGSDFEISSSFTLPYSLFQQKDYSNPVNKYTWIEYYKIKFHGFLYKQIIGDLVLKLGGEFGFLSAYNKDKGISPFQRFSLGGVPFGPFHSGGKELIPLRGYSSEDEAEGEGISPKKGGTLYNKMMLELRYPLLQKGIQAWAIGFLEAGSIAEKSILYDPFEMRKSIGVGIRALAPMIGLFGLDIGYGFNQPNPTNDKLRVHVIFGKNI